MNREVAFFDFDGTITFRDSLAEFIRFYKGPAGFIGGLIPLLPQILAFKAGLIDRQLAKEKLLTKFFRGITDQHFNSLAITFAKEKIPTMLRPQAVEKLNWHKVQGHEVVIVSASPVQWLEPWCVANGYSCISTILESKDRKITGKIVGLNCYGEEKVRRIKEKYQLENYSRIYAYGDTSGDLPMLKLAHDSYYKPFRQ